MAAGLTMDALDRFLVRQRARHWSWPETNCALWVADWIQEQAGVDPARAVRGKAADAEQWKALIDRGGGFMPMVGEAMDRCGLARTQSPQRGAAAIVTAPVSLCNRMPVVGTIMGLCVAPADGDNIWPLVVVRSLRGLHYHRFALVTAWTVPLRRLDILAPIFTQLNGRSHQDTITLRNVLSRA